MISYSELRFTLNGQYLTMRIIKDFLLSHRIAACLSTRATWFLKTHKLNEASFDSF